MKRRFGILICLAAVLICALALADTAIDTTTFPDAKFRKYVSDNFDTNKDSMLSEAEIAAVTSIACRCEGVASMEGIQVFTALKELDCNNNSLTSLDVSRNTALTTLICYSNRITELDVSRNPALSVLNCDENKLTGLDVTGNAALTSLCCSSNALKKLDVSRNPLLEALTCEHDELTELDLSHNPALKELHCGHNSMTSLDVSSNPALEIFWCYVTPLTSLDVSRNTALKKLYVTKTDLTSLDVSQNAAMEELRCDDCSKLTSLNLRGAAALKRLDTSRSPLTSLDVSQNAALEELICKENQLTRLDTAGATALKNLSCQKNPMTRLTVGSTPGLQNLTCFSCELTSLDLSRNSELQYLWCYDNKLTGLDVSKNTKLALLYIYTNKIRLLDVTNCPALSEEVRNNARKYSTYSGHDLFGTYSSAVELDTFTTVIAGEFVSKGEGGGEFYDISGASIGVISNQVYTGKAIKPKVTVQYDGKTLTAGTDYTVSYQKNKDIGTAEVTISGTGDYYGSKTVSFDIIPKKAVLSSLKAGKKQLTVKWKKGSGIDGYEIEYSLKKNFSGAKTVTAKKAKTSCTIKKLKTKKTYYVRIRAYKKVNGKTYYSEWSKVKKAKVK